MKRPWEHVAIIGVGLIGGSLGRALRRLGVEVTGIGRNSARLETAVQAGVIDRGTTDLAASVSQADVVVICTPVPTVVSLARQLSGRVSPTCLVTDVGSTKQRIVAEIRQVPGVNFVGSHPLAGSEQTGFEAARSDLFEDRVVVVTPAPDTPEPWVDAAAQLWTAVGARIVRMAPAEHDRVLAATSHLPHLVASALSATLTEQQQPLVASGWRDTTRIAAGDAELWAGILAENRVQVLQALARFQRSLDSIRSALAAEDFGTLQQLLEEGKRNRESVGN